MNRALAGIFQSRISMNMFMFLLALVSSLLAGEVLAGDALAVRTEQVQVGRQDGRRLR